MSDRARHRASRWAPLVGALLLGCGGGVVQRADALPPPPPGLGFVQITSAPADVEIYVDGAFQGRLDGYPEGVIKLPTGRHRVSLRKRGYYAWHGEVVVGDDASAIRTHLVPLPP